MPAAICGSVTSWVEENPDEDIEDDLRYVDWKVFGRSDKLYLKQYQQETNLDIVILVDASASMRFGTLRVKQGWGGTDASNRLATWTKFDHATAIGAARPAAATTNAQKAR